MMYKLKILAAILSLNVLANAEAAILEFSPSLTTVEIGSIFTETIVVDGLASGTYLSGFDVSINYDPVAFHYLDGNLGSNTGLTPTFASDLKHLTTSGIFEISPGRLEWSLSSHESAGYFNSGASGQQGRVVLGTVQFQAFPPGGTLGFETTGNTFIDQNGNKIEIDDPVTATINITDVPALPEPGTLLLSCAGLALITAITGKKARFVR
jgi:hypothetical protein